MSKTSLSTLQKPSSDLHAGEPRRAALFVTPALVLLAIVIIYPVTRAIIMSVQRDSRLNPETGMFETDGSFAWFDNYLYWILQRCAGPDGTTIACPSGTLGAGFWNAFWVTIFFTVVSVGIEIILGLWFAMIMNRNFRGRGILRASVLIPWAIPTAVTAKLFFFIFAYDGIANKLLGTNILWTGDEWPSRFAVIFADVWKTAPFMALLILAGLQVIPKEVYEAAKVDGASAWQTFRMITLPLVKPALMVAVLFRVLDVLRIYDLPAILTGGGGGDGTATTTLSILVVDQVRQGFNRASALSTITFLFIFFVAFIFVRFLGANVAENRIQKKAAKP